MAWIGYNPSGYAELESEIKSRKAALIDILDTFKIFIHLFSSIYINCIYLLVPSLFLQCLLKLLNHFY